MTRTKMPDLKTSKRHAEILCRRLVMHRATDTDISGGVPICERCGYGRATEWAHIIRRHLAATRCDPLNTAALCNPCHRTIDNDAVEMVEFIEKTIGMDAYYELKRKSQAGLAAVSLSPRAFWLSTRTDLIEQCREAGLSTQWKD